MTDSGPKQMEIQGVLLHLVEPDVLKARWVGQGELLTQLLAAWMVIDEDDLPLNPRLLGKPGVGKTTLAYSAAQKLGRDVYIMQATMDTRPEDLIVLPVVGEDQKIRYVASPLVSAMLTGGILVLDEGNRMSEKSWASLAPLLDVAGSLAGAPLIAGRPPRNAIATAMTNDENRPRRGSTPAMIEKAMASGISAMATTSPASTSRVSSLGLRSACSTVGSMR